MYLLKKSLCLFFLPVLFFANPQGLEVKSGDISISSEHDQMTVLQASDKAIVNWETFSVAQEEKTRFVLPSEKASTLNRVIGDNISEINGSLKSNGLLYLINQNGIVVGPSGKVDTAGFIGSTYDLSDKDYLSNKELGFSERDIVSSLKIVNQGTISASHGDIVLISKEIENDGQLIAEKGKASLNAGLELYLMPDDQMKTVVRLKREGQVKNSGSIKTVETEIQAAGGSAYALAIDAGGIIDAQGITEKDGRIILASDDGWIDVTGKLSSHNKKQAIDLKEQKQEKSVGGTVHLLGKTVKLEQGSFIEASGELGGGEVLVGGDYQGKNPNIKNADFVYMDKEADIFADALENGNGGKVILWSEKATDWRGFISAKGGKETGDGGFVEASSKGFLNPKCRVDVKAENGKNGELLLDPSNITITDSASSPAWTNPYNPGPSEANPCNVQASDITGALNGGSNVTISTSNGDQGDGDITVSVEVGWTTAQKLTLIATRTLTVDSAGELLSSYTAGNFDAIDITAGGTSGNYKGVVNQGSIMAFYGNINITATGGDTSDNNYGVHNNGGEISTIWIMTPTSCGNITINGTGGAGGNTNYGIRNDSQGKIYAMGSGTVTLTGTGGAGTDDNYGIQNYGNNSTNTSIYTTSGALTLTGTGGGTGSRNYGIWNDYSGQIYSNSGTVYLKGQGSTSATGNDNIGVRSFYSSAGGHTAIHSTSGDIKIKGIGGGSGSSNRGIYIYGGKIYTAGSGNITMEGKASFAGTTQNEGVNLQINGSNNPEIYTENGDITILGIGRGSTTYNRGILLQDAAKIYTTETGNIKLTGYGATAGTEYGYGVQIYSQASVYATSTSGTDAGSIEINGYGGGSGRINQGVKIEGGDVYTEDNGTIDIKGRASVSGGYDCKGVDIRQGDGQNVEVKTVNGNITIIGRGEGNADGCDGIFIYNSSQVYATGSGNIKLIGYGSQNKASTYWCWGIRVQESSKVYTATGNIYIIGKAGGYQSSGDTNNQGVMNYSSSQIYTGSGDPTVIGDLSGGGDLVIVGEGGYGYNKDYGIYNDSSYICSGGGKVKLVGKAGGTGTNNHGIYNNNSSKIYSNGDRVNVIGTAGRGTGSNRGVYNNNSEIYTVNADLYVTGYGQGSGDYNQGVYNVSGAAIQTTGSGNVFVQGYGSNSGTSSYNIGISNNNASIYTTDSGNVTVRGIGGSGTTRNYGIRNCGGGDIYSSSSGNVTLYGKAGDYECTEHNYGISNEGSGTTIYTNNGDLTIVGIGGGTGDSNYGILTGEHAEIYSSGSGNVTLKGFGSFKGEDFCLGIVQFSVSDAAVTQIYVTSGDLTLIGLGRGSGTQNYGIFNYGEYCQITVAAGSASKVSLIGYGSTRGSATSHGIYQDGTGSADTKITSENGDLVLKGIGGPGGDGILNENSGVIETTGTGTLTEIDIDG